MQLLQGLNHSVHVMRALLSCVDAGSANRLSLASWGCITEDITMFRWLQNEKLYVFCRLKRNQPTGLCFHVFAMIQTCAHLYSSNFTPQVKDARNQSQIFNRKSISRDTTHRQSYHLQVMLTGVIRRKAKTRSEKVNNLKTAMKKTRGPNHDK